MERIAGLRPGARAVALAFLASGTVHLVRPSVFRPLVPPALPAKDELILVTGVAELACAIGLGRGARWAPAASVATLLAVWPGNWWMAIELQRQPTSPPMLRAAAWLRVPLQIPMILAALDPVARREPSLTGRPSWRHEPHWGSSRRRPVRPNRPARAPAR